MARKPDLFSLIAERQRAVAERNRAKAEAEAKGGAAQPDERRPEPARAAPAKSAGLLASGSLQRLRARARAFWERVLPPARRATPRPEFRLGLGGIAGVALVAVAVGFLAGRLFAPAAGVGAGSQQELVAQGGAKPGPAARGNQKAGASEPTWLVVPKEGVPPSSENQTEVLANWCYPVLLYPASQRASAERLAGYLWKHGVASARIRSFQHESKDYWGAVVYVPSVEDGPRYVEALAKVPTPDFAPDLQDYIRKLRDDAPWRVNDR